MEGGIVDVSALEPADIGGPPGYTRQPHIQASGKLIAKRMEGGMHIPGPGKHAKALASGPRAAHQIHDIALAVSG
ncbi:hypothetical protein D3C76_1339930 [compost metagenome]